MSVRSGRGKHTTRHVSLLPLSGGGYLADTPGFNQPSLMKVTKQSLPQYFPEVSTTIFVLYVKLVNSLVRYTILAEIASFSLYQF